jgi:hypothetical protein
MKRMLKYDVQYTGSNGLLDDAQYRQQGATGWELLDDVQYTDSKGPRAGSCWMMCNIHTATGGESGAAG